MRDFFIENLRNEAKKNKEILLISNEQGASALDKFRKELTSKGIETGTHYKPIHKMSFYKSSKKILNTEKAAKEIVTIPIHPNLTQPQLDYIIKSINKFA